MPKRAIEIHDSVLYEVSFVGGQAELRLKVYIHQSEDNNPEYAARTGWTSDAILRIADCKMSGQFSKFPVILGDGHVRIGTEVRENEIPIPLSHAGVFQLRLESISSPEVVVFSGSAAELELLGDPKFIEEFKP